MEFPEDIEAAIPISELLNQISLILMVKVDQVIYMIKKYLDEDGDISDRLSILTTMIETEPYCRGLLTVVNHVTGHSFSSQEDFLKFYFGDNNGEANICRVFEKACKSDPKEWRALFEDPVITAFFSRPAHSIEDVI